MVTDLAGSERSDPRFVYRLSIRQPTPDFRLVAVPRFPPNNAEIGKMPPTVWNPSPRRGGAIPDRNPRPEARRLRRRDFRHRRRAAGRSLRPADHDRTRVQPWAPPGCGRRECERDHRRRKRSGRGRHYFDQRNRPHRRGRRSTRGPTGDDGFRRHAQHCYAPLAARPRFGGGGCRWRNLSACARRRPNLGVGNGTAGNRKVPGESGAPRRFQRCRHGGGAVAAPRRDGGRGRYDRAGQVVGRTGNQTWQKHAAGGLLVLRHWFGRCGRPRFSRPESPGSAQNRRSFAAADAGRSPLRRCDGWGPRRPRGCELAKKSNWK